MTKTLDEIKRLRKKYHLTQQELAKRAGVSQSLIAKIEAGLLDPTYTRAEQIFGALENVEEQKELKAKDVMHQRVAFASLNDAVKEVIKILRQKGISQMPVMDSGKHVCGMISERAILDTMAEHPERLGKLRVSEVMEEIPPMVAMNTGFRTLSVLLKDNPAILVMERGEVRGIISKADLLGKME